MSKRCIYCKTEIAPTSVIDFCEKCGIGTWGVKMFNAIKNGMEESRKRGDLEQGNIS